MVVYAGSEERAGCEGCVYADQHLFCVYILVEHQSRGVPVKIGGGCEKKRTGATKKIPCMEDSARYIRNHKANEFDDEAAAILYGQGAVDIQIAKSIGAKREDVAQWRSEMGVESNEITRRITRKMWISKRIKIKGENKNG